MKKSIILLCVSWGLQLSASPSMPLVKGEPFPDSEGRHINAHGGGIMEKDGTYYWYGEHRGDGTPGSWQKGVICYSSTDLHSWDNHGIVLPVVTTPGHMLEQGCTIERPKVIYCPATDKYVMWFHHELKGRGYGAAFSGVATADSPYGPFQYISSSRVNPGWFPVNLSREEQDEKWDKKLEWWTPEWKEQIVKGSFVKRDLYGGQMARDMTLFVDDDGKAYHIYSSEDNLTLHIAELDSTFTTHTGKYIRLFPGGHNEAPALFKHDGKYWMITSGCTGWAPNEARLMVTDSIMGEWKQLPSPCRGKGAKTTFDSQGTFVMKIGDTYTFMADKWNPKNLGDSRHLWLPIKFDNYGLPYIDSPEQ